MVSKSDLVVAAAATAAAGPLLSDYGLIFCFAVFGGLVGLSAMPPPTPPEKATTAALKFMMGSVPLSLSLSWVVAKFLHLNVDSLHDFSQTELLVPVSLIISLFSKSIISDGPALVMRFWPWKKSST